MNVAQQTTDDRRNIKLNSEAFERLKEQKPDGVTWDYYLLSMLEEDEE
jgi:hypothetical protein